MRKIPDAYNAICGILLPLMRHYTETHKLLHTVIQSYLNVPMRKIAGAHASTYGFPHYSLYGAIPLLQSNYASMRGKIKEYTRYCADFQGFAVVVQYLFLLVMKCISGAINRITRLDVILFVYFGDHVTH